MGNPSWGKGYRAGACGRHCHWRDGERWGGVTYVCGGKNCGKTQKAKAKTTSTAKKRIINFS